MRASLYSPSLVYKSIVLWLGLSVVFQGVFYVFSLYHYGRATEAILEEIKLRVSVDLAAKQVAGEILQPNTERSQQYLAVLNEYIAARGWPVLIEKITFHREAPEGDAVLALPSGVFMYYQPSAPPWYAHFSVLPWGAALLISLFFYVTSSRLGVAGTARKPTEQQPAPPPAAAPPADDGRKGGLKIDLQLRRLSHLQSGHSAELANKPLCFYLALIEYCRQRPTAFLNQNRDLPPDLLALCEEYFQRMNQLGHAVRKRPDFNKNLEKTLSEIRSSLDQVFAEDPEQKAVFYPRKAIGEGSRSKIHNYVPAELNTARVEIHGLESNGR